MQKRVLAVNDISCVGRCSLTVALPVISACGIECSVLPTAVLSTHTGGFSDFTYRDLTHDIVNVADHWQKLGIGFDAVYTGYLGSFEQLSIVSSVIDRFRTGGNMIVVDPVMADNGSFYSLFTEKFAEGMASLCRKADIITPNLTEAAFLVKERYIGGVQTREYIENILLKLYGMCSATVIMTGVCFKENEISVAVYDGNTPEYFFSEEISGDYPGSGDVFASSFVAAVVSGRSFESSVKIAMDFTLGAIRRTKDAGTDVKYGLDFENGIAELIAAVQED